MIRDRAALNTAVACSETRVEAVNSWDHGNPGTCTGKLTINGKFSFCSRRPSHA